MKDEVKEILDRMQELVKHKYDKEIHTYNLFDDIQGLLDYITNLQEENKRLKELCDKYEEEHSTTFEYWKQLVKEDYKSRNKKAIEYTKQFINGKTSRIDEWKNVELVLETIIQLLQGEDKDDNN